MIGTIGIGVYRDDLNDPLVIRFLEGTSTEDVWAAIESKGYKPICVLNCSHEGEGYVRIVKNNGETESETYLGHVRILIVLYMMHFRKRQRSDINIRVLNGWRMNWM